jgi:phage shock protein B
MSFGEILIALAALSIPLLAIAMPVILILGLVRIFTGRSVRRNPQQEAEEARLMQELHHGMARLENRIENLETVVLEREGHKTDVPTE